MKLTKKDYQNALEIYNDWSIHYNIKLTFADYIEEIIAELEQPEKRLYKCIQAPPHDKIDPFKIGKTYVNSDICAGFNLSDLPNHFELVVPEPKPEKITWQEVITLIDKIKRKGFLPQDFYIEILKTIRQIQTDHL